jgi:assimilatory nitrate reductase catalytic subunit
MSSSDLIASSFDPGAVKENTKIKHTTCAYCGVGCGIKASIDEQTRTVNVIGFDQHPSNYGRLCSKGSALGDTVSLDERLLEPEVNGQQVDWDTALDTVANGFKKVIDEHGPDSVAFYLSGQLLTEDYYVANKLMKGFIGSANIDTNSRLCMSSSVVGHKRAFGTDTVPGCYEDFEHADLITLVGSNTAWCHPVLFQRIKTYKENNPHVKVVVIDPRRTQTCDIADLHLPVDLGTDVWLFNGLLNAINKQGKLDQDYIDQHCQGLEESLKAAEKSSGDIVKLAKQLGLNESDLQQFFDLFCQTEKSITLYSQGVNQSSSGTDKVNSIINCHLATRRIGKKGTGPFSMTGQPNAMGGREVGGLANTLAGHLDFYDDNIDRLNRFWDTKKVPSKPGLMAVDLFDAIDEGKIKAVWIMATNPAVSMPNADKVKRALEKCDLVVVSDNIKNTDTVNLATVKLPATGWSEKDGTVTNSERRISRQRSLFEKAGNAQHDWWAVTQVAKRLGFEDAFNYTCQADIFREHASLSGFENSEAENHRRRDFDISKLQTITADEYEALQPFQWPLNDANPNGKQRFFEHGEFFTANKKANFLALEPKLPKNLPTNDYPLRLNTGRIRDQWHTMTRSALAPQLNQHISEPFIEVHPSDAKALNLMDQQLITVTSKWGQMTGRLNISDIGKPGNIFAPMHWTASLSKTGRINPVVNPEVDPFCFQPESKHTPVNIKAKTVNHFGFVLSQNEITWPNVDYVVRAKGKGHHRYELAHSEKIESQINTMLSWLGFENETQLLDKKTGEPLELLSYLDDGLGLYRLALLNASGKLVALAMLETAADSQQPNLPERTWLAMQFTKGSLDKRARQALLSGFAPAGEDIGRMVCACFSVGEKTIQKAVKGGCQNVKDVGDKLKAGTNCGSCVPEIKDIITKFNT